jgi:hypothetical protein
MRLRAVRQGGVARDVRRETLHEDIVRTITGGSLDEKLQAIILVANQLERKALGVHEAESMLCLALHDENRQVRRSAIIMISQHGSSMLEGLRVSLGNEDAGVRGMGAAMISSALQNNKSALRSAMMSNDGRVRGVARDLLNALMDDHQVVRMHSLSALRELARRSPMETLDEADIFMGRVGERCFELDCRLEIVRSEALQGIEEQGKRFTV